MKFKGAIFDLDGTLLDSMPFWKNIGAEYLVSKGHNPPENITEILKEMSLDQSAAYFRKEFAIQETEDEIVKGILSLVEDHYRYRIPLKNPVIPLLDRLHESNIRMCIATATGYSLAKAAVERLGIDKYFEFIFTCTEAGVGKDSPEFFLKALSILNTPKHETLVFEDALHAIKSAKAAGLRVAAVYDDSSDEDWEEIKTISDICLYSFEDWDIKAN
ncbi:MAG: HAD family hydrolase [Clostridiaceae bacterium]|nr:HAD family hydrolase [Clostridiaceae bacterium]